MKEEELVMHIPNETTRRLYYDYIKEAYEETEAFSMDWYIYNRLMHEMAYRGEWKPLFEYIGQRMKESITLQDLITGEKAIQVFLSVYLGLSQLYIIHTEKGSNLGYADIFMEPFTARYREMKYAYLLETKYIKKGEKEKEKKIKVLIKDAEEQLERYSLDGKLKKALGNTTLIRLVLVFSGPELIYIDEPKSLPLH